MLAVISAREGSKGVPGKNIKELAGKPMIAYTIEAAIKSEIFDKIVVSTDSQEIAEIALKYGVEVPFIRPAEISGDLVSSDDVALQTLQYYESQGMIHDEVCKLQPTSPLRNAEHIKSAYGLFKERKADYLVSVCECEHSPLWAGIIGVDLRLDDFISEEVKRACRQDMPICYRLNGAIYMGKTDCFYKSKNFFRKNSIAFIMKQEESIDIDSQLDFDIAEIMKN